MTQPTLSSVVAVASHSVGMANARVRLNSSARLLLLALSPSSPGKPLSLPVEPFLPPLLLEPLLSVIRGSSRPRPSSPLSARALASRAARARALMARLRALNRK